ncbi:proline-rich transmembrane protein 4 [Sphaeramia orbicularis]|uniref:Proline-rich transmembrane protein 4-like n=1 Tax=Sphaeramia orbicularis TaxID=375764 RepID=A0A673B491_9TELE|nr:proline-rich transmembrane protein 4-like [Sphaeramia orbicularis]XP_030004150.1 proline-rich transmembrane protein 4-like [Sphaeramia orbicularis]
MLRLHRTLAFLWWCFLLLQRQSAADEEASWGTKATPSRETPPENKSSSYWFNPLARLPPFTFSLSSLRWGGSSNSNEEEAALTTTSKGLTGTIDHLQDQSGSGEGSISETSEPPTTLTQGLLTSVTKIRTERLPTGSSSSPHSSIAQSDNDTLVSDSYSPTTSSTINTLFTKNTASTNAPEQNATHTHTPLDTVQATRPSMSATAQHLPTEHTDKMEADDVSEKISLTIAPETTVPTVLTWATAEATTVNPALVEITLSRHPLGPTTPSTASENTFVTKDQDLGVTLSVGETTMIETHPTLREADLGFSEARSGLVEEQQEVITTATWIDDKLVLESTTESLKVTFPIAGELPAKEDQEDETEEGVVPSAADEDGETRLTNILTPSAKLITTSLLRSTKTPHIQMTTEDWITNPVDSDITFLPDCNKEHFGICNNTDTWDTTTALDVRTTLNNTAMNQSNNPFLIPAPPMLVPLYTDWNSAMAAWGMAWEVHVYGLGCIFAMLTLASALNLLCLPLRCPSGCGYFALVSLFLLAAGCTRSFSLLYDAYGHQDRLPSTEASLMLYEAPFPCLTAAFGLVFLLLSMRSRMQLSYSAFQRPCFLACLVVLHFAAAFGPVTLLKFYQQKAPLCLFLSLISRGAFVVLATFLSAAYFVFYIYVRADSKHIYHLNNTSPTPAERYNRCPFAESRDWDRAAVTVCISALFSLACAGLQLYAMLNAMGVAGGEEVFHPWPWWAFQFSCRLCELGVCLTLALVVAQPVYCSDHLPAAGSCWTELLSSKSPILPGSYQWTMSQQEKLAIVDTVGLGETESLPLYTLMDERLGSSLNGLDLLYHSNRALAYRDLDLDLDLRGLEKHENGGGGEPSGGSSFTSDSTTDLHPPSPINLRRSIDEALFSEALFPMSLFGPARSIHCSDHSINNHCTLPSNGFCDPLSVDSGLYRTSSCVEMAPKPQPVSTKSKGETVVGAPPSPSLSSSSTCSSPERWRGSSSSSSLYRTSLGGSSLVLCPSPERHAQQALQQGGTGQPSCSSRQGFADPQQHYHTLGAASQESLDLDMSSEADRSVQEEFISVCRQIDALSICSETIDL